MHKIVLFFFAALFLYFAYVQLNDPDPLKWLMIYGLTGLLPLAMLVLPKAKYGIHALIATLIFFFFLELPNFMNWAQEGFPSITSTMKAENPYVELVREFLGIFICLIYLGAVLFFMRTKNAVVRESELSSNKFT